MVVAGAMGAKHDHFIGHALGVGKTLHPGDVEPGEAGRGGERDRRRGSAGDDAGLRAGVPGDGVAGPRLQLRHVHECACRFAHRIEDLRRHQAAPSRVSRPAPLTRLLTPRRW
jgi:hypothetical protein